MKRVSSPEAEPELFAAFRSENPDGSWKRKRGSGRAAFKDVEGNHVVFDTLASAQGHICAYCEIEVSRPMLGQVEHFVSEDFNDGIGNYALDFDNLLACCEGGTRVDLDNGRAEPPIRDTLHCGQLKDSGKTTHDPRGDLLDPRSLPGTPLIWRFGSDGSMSVDTAACVRAAVRQEVAQTTIERLGLDRRVLRRLRGAVRDQLESEFELLIKEDGLDDEAALERVATDQLVPQEGRLPGFWSTIRHWAGDAAERVLERHGDTIPGMLT